ncbi:hypothetical protein BCR32DRAFT_284713 [Anaeromyces robustus]|uniref:Uncharacterized protein n=1 Tax=Anaeromyces robustus TaxID=1754192 RepID=A0A1Y1WR17_9FUNG|nr:hypothetical protein BCR32DRAFT_284713 [Anaeromyces robustus]|eukprot:ORX75960.1 hypothetical protein BCR32DRAFT_284713 [Anaeromyces robustus]
MKISVDSTTTGPSKSSSFTRNNDDYPKESLVDTTLSLFYIILPFREEENGNVYLNVRLILVHIQNLSFLLRSAALLNNICCCCLEQPSRANPDPILLTKVE